MDKQNVGAGDAAEYNNIFLQYKRHHKNNNM